MMIYTTTYRLCGLFSLMFLSIVGSAQYFSMEREQTLLGLYTGLQEAEDDSSRRAASDLFKAELSSALYSPGAFSYPFSALVMGKMTSPDNAFRLFNWNVPMEDGTEHYEALLMTYDKKREMAEVFSLDDHSDSMDEVENKMLTERKWYGALYYKIVPFKKGGKKYYLLIGWDGHTATTNRKVVEVLTLGRKSLRFGAPVFKVGDRTKRRLVYTYAEEVAMTVQYRPSEKRIILDHLSPKNQSLEGQHQFYVPDMTFDSFNYKRGRWTYMENVEFLRKRTPKDKDFKDPRKE